MSAFFYINLSSDLSRNCCNWLSFYFFLSSVLFLKNLFININSIIPCLESSLCRFFIYQTVCVATLYLPYQHLGKCPLSSYYWNTTSQIPKKREKDLFRLPCPIPAKSRCFPGDSFSLLQKVRKLKQLFCIWLFSCLVLPLCQTNFLAIFNCLTDIFKIGLSKSLRTITN